MDLEWVTPRKVILMKSPSNYWVDRVQKQTDLLFNKTAKEIDAELIKKYNQAYKDTVAEMTELWDKLMKDAVDGKIKPNDLYRYNRYYQIQSNLNQRLLGLGADDNRVLSQALVDLYKETSNSLQTALKDIGVVSPTMTMEQDSVVENVVKSIWTADGQHWSDRVWKNKARLQERIEKGLMDCVSRGVSKEELVKTLLRDFNIGYREADRLARTEMTYVQNQAAKNRYEDAGITQYRFLAEIDSRTSSLCREKNGKVYNFVDASVGVNIPPIHPSCRSTIIPVINT